jgi:hypothetical protein
VASLEQTKEVLITRSESLTDVSAKINSVAPTGAGEARSGAAVPVSVAHTIEAGLQGAKEILTSLDTRIPR